LSIFASYLSSDRGLDDRVLADIVSREAVILNRSAKLNAIFVQSNVDYYLGVIQISRNTSSMNPFLWIKKYLLDNQY
jgi:hypothetical protein